MAISKCMVIFIALTTLCVWTDGFIAPKKLSDIPFQGPDDNSPINPVAGLPSATAQVPNARRVAWVPILFWIGRHIATEVIIDAAINYSHDKTQWIAYTRGFDFCAEEMKRLKLWDKGVVPYYIDKVSFSDQSARHIIKGFLERVNLISKMKFIELPTIPHDERTRWVLFLNRRGLQDCGDQTIHKFTTQGVQRVVLGYECMNSGGGLAEAVLAIAGVPPQHNSPDRDQFIQINLDNIIPEKKDLFTVIPDSEWLFHDLEYDFKSAGHYHAHRYSSNGRATIEVKYGNATLDENLVLSHTDILKIKMLYNFISGKVIDTQICNQIYVKNTNNELKLPKASEDQPEPKPLKYLNAIGFTEKGEAEVLDENLDANDGGNNTKEDDSPNERILLMNKKRYKKNKKIVDKITYDLTHLNDEYNSD